MDKNISEKLNKNLSFAGCGFLGIYHVGVGVCFKQYASHLLIQKIAGVSAGAIVAVALLLDLPLDDLVKEFFEIASNARSHPLGPFAPSFNIQEKLLNGFEQRLPEDAHLKLSGRLHISLTRIFDRKNVIVSQFESREDLMNALACSFFIPGFSGLIPPKFHGVRYMDGAFSDNLVMLDDNTVTVSPFCGETDISPKNKESDVKYHISLVNTSMELCAENARLLLRSLLPLSPAELSNLCQRGFDDALDYLYHNNLISCNDCVINQTNFITTNCDETILDPDCDGCTESRENSVSSSIPDYLMTVLDQHVEGSQNMMTKLFRFASLPIVIPCSFASHLIQKVPEATQIIYNYRRSLTEQIHQIIVTKMNDLMSKVLTYEEEFLQHKESKKVVKCNSKYQRRNGNSK
ncbi:hypothetical protein PVAND_016141 [Polypedilum vanderplanki]|uniref:PNPLA domain-containing protein n=1 Tax=Polypedilum vanderplanki TaxID=319348 RepID=A0A9J6BEZ9_POLVA|nr:hypothetical protein PVAND_016141 [Polypedilum vanderplanki]